MKVGVHARTGPFFFLLPQGDVVLHSNSATDRCLFVHSGRLELRSYPGSREGGANSQSYALVGEVAAGHSFGCELQGGPQGAALVAATFCTLHSLTYRDLHACTRDDPFPAQGRALPAGAVAAGRADSRSRGQEAPGTAENANARVVLTIPADVEAGRGSTPHVSRQSSKSRTVS